MKPIERASTLPATSGPAGAAAWNPPRDAQWLWSTLAEDSLCPVLVLSSSGTVEYANHAAQETMGMGVAMVGRTIGDLMGETMGRERVEHTQAVLGTGRTIVFEELRGGRQHRCVIRPMPDGRSVLMMYLPSMASLQHTNGFPVVKARVSDAGRLAQLTQRELEILRLIGLGMSTQEVAEHLGRSVKTIEWHRVSLGEKLGVTNRVELARIAIAAGLVSVDDKSPGQPASAPASPNR